MGLAKKNEELQVVITQGDSEDSYPKNVYRPRLRSGVIILRNHNTEQETDDINLISNIGDVDSIDDWIAGSVSVPATIAELFDTIRPFFFRKVTYAEEELIWTMPQEVVEGQIIVYTGYARDKSALTSEAKWAVKKQYQNNTVEWAGELTYDQILDNYLSLTYI